jgi:predicted GIY-YIG superfamily endonuclease
MTIGVYAVVNKVNNRAYIGSSKRVELRLINHKSYINTRNFLHYQGYEEDANIFNVADFEFKLIKATNTIEEAKELEAAFIELFLDKLYNKSPSATGASGVKRDRAKYIQGAAKRNSDPEYAKKLSDACKGKRQLVVCPTCGLSGGGGNMRRYHFDNCRNKK